MSVETTRASMGAPSPNGEPIGKTPRDTAVGMLAAGLWPIPIYPPGVTLPDRKKPTEGKEPIGKAWGAERNTIDKLAATFKKYPRAGVGVALGPGRGPGGVWLLDVEGDGPEAAESRLRLFGGEVIDTFGWSSARGDGHQLLIAEADRLAELLPGLAGLEGTGFKKGAYHLPGFPDLEIRPGGIKPDGTVKQLQSVFPPTVGTDGKPRQWNGVATIAPAPEGLYQALAAADGSARPNGPPSPPPAGEAKRRPASNDVEARAIAYLDKIPGGVSGQGGSNPTYKAACKIGPGFDLPQETAFRLLRDHYNPRCVPSWSDQELQHKVDDAYKAPENSPRGWLLNAGRDGHNDNGRHNGNGQTITSGKPELEEDDSEPLEVPGWISPPDPLVYSGLAGCIVQAIEPTTEADPLALLGQFLASFGSVVGRGPHCEVEATRHHTNEFMLFVGESAVSRKGTSAGRIKAVFSFVDPDWLRLRVVDGLSSGEGLLNAVRDPVYGKEPIKEKGRITGYQEVMQDEGVTDKRLYVLESEFGGVLRANEREGNRLSTYIRMLWDSGSCASMTKSPTRTTNANVSIVGHITEHELRERLRGSDLSNGLANRFLFFAVRRSKILPFGGEGFDPQPFIPELRAAVEAARGIQRATMDRDARNLWKASYERLTTPAPGVLGQVTNRAAPHTLRLALLYALLDRCGVISEQHLAAALKLWEASFRCAAYIFGDSIEDPRAERILAALRQHPDGMTRTEISVSVFNRNEKTGRIKAALVYLLKHHLATETTDRPPTGRPRTVYKAADGGLNSFNSSISYFVGSGEKEGVNGEKKKEYEKNELDELTPLSQPVQATNSPLCHARTQDEVNELTPPCGGCLRLDCRECNP